MQNYSISRRRRPLQPIVLQQGQVAYRVVCHSSIVGGLIGPSGSIISQIRGDTGCTVHCDEPVKGSDHRLIIIVGPACPGRKIALKSTNGDDRDRGGGNDDDEEREIVSMAQEAVIRVCERMWEVDADKRGGGKFDDNSEGYCGLLADTTQIGAVVGRGGKNVLRMRRESGAHIRILPAPHCASKDDELIQITGSTLAVKKALLAVTECLYDCPPYDKIPKLLTRPLERASHTSSSDPHAEFFPHLSSLLPPLNEISVNSHSPDVAEDPKKDRAQQNKVSFRLLCSNGAAGSIIGKKGTIVRTLQNETGASIMFAAPLTTSGDRVVTVSALENLESWFSPAQNAVVLVFARSIEHDIDKAHSSGLIEGTTVTARLLVASDDACCLNGKDGNLDPEMKEVSGADIEILEGQQILDPASEDDVVVEITGEYKNVQNALFIVTGKLRNNLLYSEVLNEVRASSPPGSTVETASVRVQQPAGQSLNFDQETTLTRGIDQLQFSCSSGSASLPGAQSPEKFGRGPATMNRTRENSSTTFTGGSELERSLHFLLPKEVLIEVGASSPGGGARKTMHSGSNSSSSLASGPMQETLTQGNNQPHLSNNSALPYSMPQTSGRGSTTFGVSAELESLHSRNKFPLVTNTTVELIVPEELLGAVYGEDGSNLTRLRQISGAKVEVCDTSPSRSERVVIISGTPDQTRAAQSLFQAFILAYQ